MSILRRNTHLGRFRLRWHIRLGDQSVELWDNHKDKCWSFSVYWNRTTHPSCWWWWHNNGAVKGVDNCYDFNWNFFIFNFSYTDFGFSRYKQRS